MPTTIEEMLDDIEEASGVDSRRGGLELSTWEEGFVDSVREQYEERGYLTLKQTAVLRRIWDRI